MTAKTLADLTVPDRLRLAALLMDAGRRDDAERIIDTVAVEIAALRVKRT